MYIVYPGQYPLKRLLEQVKTVTDSAADYVGVRDANTGMITTRRNKKRVQLSPGALGVKVRE